MPLSRLLAVLTALGLVLVAGCSSSTPAPPPTDPGGPVTGPPTVAGLAVYRVDGDVRGAVARLQRSLGRAGTPAATVDHAAAAAADGQRLRPTTLVVGGDPRLTAPIQQRAAVAGVDLPVRFLVWQDERRAVWLGHDSAAYVAARAGVPGGTPPVETLARALGAVARDAARTAEPVSPGDDVDGVSTERYLATTLTSRPVPEVVAALRGALAREGMRPVAAVDHARGAARAGTPLAPSTLLVAGSPPSGTRLLQDRQTVGIDLPVRVLAWSDGTTTRISRPDPASLAARHGLRGRAAAVEALAAAQERVVDDAVGGAPARSSVSPG